MAPTRPSLFALPLPGHLGYHSRCGCGGPSRCDCGRRRPAPAPPRGHGEGTACDADPTWIPPYHLGCSTTAPPCAGCGVIPASRGRHQHGVPHPLAPRCQRSAGCGEAGPGACRPRVPLVPACECVRAQCSLAALFFSSVTPPPPLSLSACCLCLTRVCYSLT